MSETKWTPGPWRYELDGGPDNDMRNAVLAEINDLWVAACYRSGTLPRDERSADAEREAEANARLIAAAPTMADYIKRQAANGCVEAAQLLEQINGR